MVIHASQTTDLPLTSRMPSAVIGINDACAQGAILAAQDHGLSVPGEVSVVGFDNSPFAVQMRPPLTTVDFDYPLLGKTLIDVAIKAAQKEDPPRVTVIDTRLVIRESCRPLGGE